MRIKMVEGECALHVCLHSQKRSWDRDPRETWPEILDLLASYKDSAGLKPTAFALMKNHLHGLFMCYTNTVRNAIVEVMAELAMITLEDLESQQGDDFIDEIDHITNYQETYRYILRNPVTAGLVTKAEDYPYSSLPYLIGYNDIPHPFWDDMHFALSPFSNLRWVNQNPYGFTKAVVI